MVAERRRDALRKVAEERRDADTTVDRSGGVARRLRHTVHLAPGSHTAAPRRAPDYSRACAT